LSFRRIAPRKRESASLLPHRAYSDDSDSAATDFLPPTGREVKVAVTSAASVPEPTSVITTSMMLLAPQRKHSEARGFLSCHEARILVSLCLSAGGNLKGLMKAKVFLRNRATGQYYTRSTGWSGDSFVANDFDTVESATHFARTERLAGMEVVLRYDDSVCGLVLPLRQEP
jgi:hypothetical protein